MIGWMKLSCNTMPILFISELYSSESYWFFKKVMLYVNLDECENFKKEGDNMSCRKTVHVKPYNYTNDDGTRVHVHGYNRCPPHTCRRK
jgi:hypothetical protein